MMLFSYLITMWHKWGEIPLIPVPEPDEPPEHPVIEDVFRRPMPGRWESQLAKPNPPVNYFSNRTICLYITALAGMAAFICYVLIYTVIVYDYSADPTFPTHPHCMEPPAPQETVPDRQTGRHGAMQPFTLDHLYDEHMQPLRPNGTWSGGSRVHRNAAGHLVRFDGRTGAEHILLDAADPDLGASRSHQLSTDGRFVLFEQPAPYGGSFYRLVALAGATMLRASLGVDGQPADYAAFGPIGSQLVVVQNGHIMYYASSDTAQLAAKLTLQPNRFYREPTLDIYRGICDWSYATLMFDGQPALWFSSDGQQLAYATFDDRALTERNQTVRPDRPVNRWSRVNTDNPRVHVAVMNLSGVRIGEPQSGAPLPRPQELRNVPGEQLVLASAGWSGTRRLVTVWLNRQQTRAVVQSCRTQPPVDCFAITRINATDGWLRMVGPLFADADQMAVVRPLSEFNRLVVYQNISAGGGGLEWPILDELHVERIVHFDKTENIYFYLGSTPAAPWDRHLFAVRVNGRPHGVCLTCTIERVGDRWFGHFDAHFGGDRLLVLEMQGPSVPRHDIYEWSPHVDRVAVLQFRRPLQTNDALAFRLSRIRWVPPKWLHMQNSGIRIRLLVPPSLSEGEDGDDDNNDNGRPLLVQPYTGPGTYAGTSEWRLDWEAYMAANRSVIVAQVDGRGSVRSRLDSTHAVHGRLGGPEADDMRRAAIWLVRKLRRPSVDPRSIGIWGAGYAGFVAGMALARSTDMQLFECAALVRPAVDMAAAASLYAERYMGLWNETGYRNASLLAHADAVRRNALHVLLVHDGTEGPHGWPAGRWTELAEQWSGQMPPNATDMVFKQAFYPSETVDWTRTHYELTDFFDQCFDLFL